MARDLAAIDAELAAVKADMEAMREASTGALATWQTASEMTTAAWNAYEAASKAEGEIDQRFFALTRERDAAWDERWTLSRLAAGPAKGDA